MNYNELVSSGRQLIKTRIKGDFEGFNEEHLFSLENGQSWIQKNFKYWHFYAHMPFVIIYKYGNNYFLTINGQKQFVEVELIANEIE